MLRDIINNKQSFLPQLNYTVLIEEARLYNVSTLLDRLKKVDDSFNSYIVRSDKYYKLSDTMISLLNTNLRTVTLPNITMGTYETEQGSSLKLSNPNGVLKTSDINMTFRYNKDIHKLFYYTIIYGMFNEVYIPYTNPMSYFWRFVVYSQYTNRKQLTQLFDLCFISNLNILSSGQLNKQSNNMLEISVTFTQNFGLVTGLPV